MGSCSIATSSKGSVREETGNHVFLGGRRLEGVERAALGPKRPVPTVDRASGRNLGPPDVPSMGKEGSGKGKGRTDPKSTDKGPRQKASQSFHLHHHHHPFLLSCPFPRSSLRTYTVTIQNLFSYCCNVIRLHSSARFIPALNINCQGIRIGSYARPYSAQRLRLSPQLRYRDGSPRP